MAGGGESTTFHCELAWLGGDAAEADVAITVAGDRISSVDAGAPLGPGDVRLRGLTLPGFANAHSHAFHRALRGRSQAEEGTFWTWREQMYEVADRLDPDSYHRLARAVYGEMALAGISCVGEFHYLHHGPGGARYDDPNAMGEALVAAASDAGIRITLLDACYLHGGIGVALEGVQRRFGDGDAASWADRVEAATALSSGTALVGAAAHSVRAVDPAALRDVAAWAEAHGAPLHAHVSEQPAENERCIEAHGLTPTGLLAECGVLSDRFTAVHATHLDAADISLLGSARSTACLCPTTERDLADGIGPGASLAAAGSPLALGSDSHAVIDMFEEARGVEVHERLARHRRGNLAAGALLTAATEAGHRSLGWADAGVIRPGALADLTTIRLDSVRTAGTSAATALESAVFAATAADVAHVVVGGRVVVDGSAHRRIDVAAELDEAIRSCA